MSVQDWITLFLKAEAFKIEGLALQVSMILVVLSLGMSATLGRGHISFSASPAADSIDSGKKHCYALGGDRDGEDVCVPSGGVDHHRRARGDARQPGVASKLSRFLANSICAM